ncbi:TetR/AcrR family transcriptional regulator [Streptacidiphilus jiangxiensis]|uniref:DNA-binding transcriptional regulator, AcrR family n=1 Tax=Streptacidiphilus jiangxiensis TaxID=235985 RepID=A0A1H7V8S8_STRJI|nr:TetR/AcrR family transcriptional regulator [Streptacidiphilus jiangxiensis]SEM05642.1 DNA-binding transcriptional regulator, AcrR family [Streptacidiphilus jiangxiensis]
MSQRINNTGELRAANAIPEEQILDAAHRLLLTIGPQRMTMADLARQAGVSRATLYRRWGSVREVLATLTIRAWTELAEQAFPAEARAEVTRAQIVDGVVTLARSIRTHPLLRTIVETDPEFLTPYLLNRRGTNTDHQLALLELALAAGMADGSVRREDPTVLAQAVLLTTWSFTLTGPVLAGAADGTGPAVDRLDDELRHLLDRYLAP